MTQVPYTFGTESSPIPLSQLDANFAVTPYYANTAGNVVNPAQANITSVGTLTSLSVTGNVKSGNLNTAGAVSASGNISVGNVLTGGIVSATGSIYSSEFATSGNITGAGVLSSVGNATVGNLLTAGIVSATGDITGANITAAGQINATQNIATVGNISAEGIITAVGNIYTDSYFVGNFKGNIVGNSVAVVGSNTQVLFNTNGNIDAVAGLTYNKGSNLLTVLGVVSSRGNIVGGANLSIVSSATIGSSLTVNGTVQISGVVTAPTAPTGTANNQLATTAFVSNQINDYATNVAISGGTISSISSVAASGTVSATALTATTRFGLGRWNISLSGDNLIFTFAGTIVAKLDTTGNFTVAGDVTGFGTL